MTTLPGRLRESMIFATFADDNSSSTTCHASRANQENRRHKQRESSQTEFNRPFSDGKKALKRHHQGGTRSETKERNDLLPNRWQAKSGKH